MKIPFNKPFFIGNETKYISQAVRSGKISGDGIFTKKCHDFFENIYGFKKVLLTTSCTAALEMAAILIDINLGDEVIMPSFTFVSTANAFVLRGAKIIFVDSANQTPNMDVESIEPLISKKTKAIIAVHYAGIACDMDPIMELAKKHNLFVVEDAAQAIEGFYKGKRLGSIGHLAAFSFHETKNIISGEGGMLVINDDQFTKRAEIIREKGTNRSQFFRGEITKYDWVDIGSSFLPSDITAAFLFAQLENIEKIQIKRLKIWNRYYHSFKTLQDTKQLMIPHIPDYSKSNGHLFYLICHSKTERDELIRRLGLEGVLAVFHYRALHDSPFYKKEGENFKLKNAELYTDNLVRLPLFFDLKTKEQFLIIKTVIDFFKK